MAAELDADFVAVRDEAWILLQRGERREAAIAFVDGFFELERKGKHREFLMTRIYVDLAVELADVIMDDEFNVEIERRRAAYRERIQKEQNQ